MGRSLTGPGNIAKLGDTMLGAFNEAHAKDIPSASSLNLKVANGNLVDITGTTTILSMTLPDGAERVLRFTGSLRLTNSEVLVLPGGADIITTPGDFAIVRGYDKGVVRVVSYQRAAGYVQRTGDTMKGTLALTAGTAIVPPLKFQQGVLSTLTIPHAFEWNGTNLYATSSTGVRKQLLYTDGDGSSLKNLTLNQVTTALGYTPFDPGVSPNRISPNGGLLEVGRYLDFHYDVVDNDYDARIECGAPSGTGTSELTFRANALRVNTALVWTNQNLTNLNQLTNGPGYAPSNNPVFTGQVTIPNGPNGNAGLTFASEVQGDTGLYGIGDGQFGFMCNSYKIIKFDFANVTIEKNTGLVFVRQDGSSLSGDVRIDTYGNTLRIYEAGGNSRGAYLDLPSCGDSVASKIVTSDQVTSSLASTGYQKLPSGLIIQWGKRANGGVNEGWVSFPIAFPSACVTVLTSYEETNGRGSYSAARGATTTGVYVATDNANTWWFALGY